MERCPCCNARLRDRLLCARCKSDLTVLLDSAQGAEAWLAEAMDCYLNKDIVATVRAIEFSLALRSTEMAREFKAFIIQQQSAEVLELFAEKQLMQAKKQLYKTRALFSSSQQLQQLNAFGDYLLLQERGVSAIFCKVAGKYSDPIEWDPT